ncbi:hypothetical protein [Microbacterium hydrocarbonoxydans]|uniref:hypothetical protein n=1 Tax=Microbacterium hydrocarbonoxydans TaxID=273678 RepID=UPI001269D9CB|nr:hypothetical protein [Microbacterium hydrocarbonoxydans]
MTDDSWTGPAIEALASSNVYVSTDVPGYEDLQASLAQTVPADGSIAVVVLPDEAASADQYTFYLLEKLTKGADQQTVILAIGDDLMGDSTALGRDAVLTIANQNEGAGMPTGLVETVQDVKADLPAGGGPGGTDSGGADVLMPVIIGGVVLVAAVGTTVGLIARRRRKPAASRKSADPVPPGIRLRVNRLRELAPSYAAVPGNAIAAETATNIDTLASHVEQLFIRLDAKAGEDQSVIAEAEYSDKLARLVAALDRDYLLDLLTRPDLWDAPDERVDEVREALTAVTTQIVDNIKQVNARKGLLFQVSLDSLIGRSELRDWERQFRKSSGEPQQGDGSP